MEEETLNGEMAQSGRHVKCDSCGGEMEYDPDSKMLVCPYCGNKQELPKSDEIAMHDFTGKERDDGVSTGDKSATVHCDNCGANIAVNSEELASKCPFCGSPLSIQRQDSNYLKPDAVIPFEVSREKAVDDFKTWIKHRFFSPRSLRKLARMKDLHGVYIPYMLYDCALHVEYTARAGTHYHETERTSDGETHEVVRTQWIPVSGTYDDIYKNITTCASKNVNKKLIPQEFDPQKLRKYSEKFLMGFQAESSSISSNDCWSAAKGIIEQQAHDAIVKEINADEVSNLNMTTNYSGIKYKIALMPVWIITYMFKRKVYNAVIDGITGKLKGKAPLSAVRIIVSILIALGIPALLYLFVNHVLGVIALIVAIIILIVLAV